MAPKFALCAGCVTPKFCREGGKCDVEALSKTKAVKKQTVSKKPKASK